MKELDIGLCIDAEGVNFFGLGEVNDLIQTGWRVASIGPGSLWITAAADGSEAPEDCRVGGFRIKVRLEKLDHAPA